MRPLTRKWLFTALALCLSLSAQGESLYMVSEEWVGATNADGTGLYWDVMREIYEPEGYDVELDVFPYARAVNMVKAGDADFWVGSYLDEEGAALYPAPEHYFDADTVKAAIPAGNAADFSGEASLEGKDIGWVRGYAYDQYLDVGVNHEELSGLESGLRMVASERLAAVMDDAWEIEQAMKSVDLSSDDLKLVHVLDLPLYPAFQDTDRGRKLRDIYDKRFPDLVESGRLQELYDKYDDYDEYRPGLAE